MDDGEWRTHIRGSPGPHCHCEQLGVLRAGWISLAWQLIKVSWVRSSAASSVIYSAVTGLHPIPKGHHETTAEADTVPFSRPQNQLNVDQRDPNSYSRGGKLQQPTGHTRRGRGQEGRGLRVGLGSRVRRRGAPKMAASICDVFSFCVGVAGRARVPVEVRFVSSCKGKGLFATQLIRKGETIFVERPLVAAQFLWNALYHYRACDHCLRALEKAEENAQRLTGKPGQVLPHPELCTVRKELHQNCPHCQVMYCSAECRLAAAEQYHRVLCTGPSQDDPLHPLNKLQEAWRSVHYPPETASIMLMARMVATVKQAKDKDRWVRLFSQFCNKTANEEEEIVHKLLGDKFKGQLELLRRLFTEALYEEVLSQWFTPDGFRSLFALVGTNGQGIGTSSLSQWVHACDALELKSQDREQLDAFIDQLYKDIEAATGEFLNCEGSGLFVLQSCCNHSCVPNAETSFPENNFLLHVTALEDIKPGEEICISYLDCCQRERSRHSRHKILRENYLFVCSCPKCLAEADEPNVTSEEEDEEEEGEPEDAELGDEMTDV